MTNKYKIDAHHEYDRIEHPFGVYVRYAGWWSRWKYICAFKSDIEAQEYISELLDLPREIYKARS